MVGNQRDYGTIPDCIARSQALHINSRTENVTCDLYSFAKTRTQECVCFPLLPDFTTTVHKPDRPQTTTTSVLSYYPPLPLITNMLLEAALQGPPPLCQGTACSSSVTLVRRSPIPTTAFPYCHSAQRKRELLPVETNLVEKRNDATALDVVAVRELLPARSSQSPTKPDINPKKVKPAEQDCLNDFNHDKVAAFNTTYYNCQSTLFRRFIGQFRYDCRLKACYDAQNIIASIDVWGGFDSNGTYKYRVTTSEKNKPDQTYLFSGKLDGEQSLGQRSSVRKQVMHIFQSLKKATYFGRKPTEAPPTLSSEKDSQQSTHNIAMSKRGSNKNGKLCDDERSCYCTCVKRVHKEVKMAHICFLIAAAVLGLSAIGQIFVFVSRRMRRDDPSYQTFRNQKQKEAAQKRGADPHAVGHINHRYSGTGSADEWGFRNHSSDGFSSPPASNTDDPDLFYESDSSPATLDTDGSSESIITPAISAKTKRYHAGRVEGTMGRAAEEGRSRVHFAEHDEHIVEPSGSSEWYSTDGPELADASDEVIDKGKQRAGEFIPVDEKHDPATADHKSIAFEASQVADKAKSTGTDGSAADKSGMRSRQPSSVDEGSSGSH